MYVCIVIILHVFICHRMCMEVRGWLYVWVHLSFSLKLLPSLSHSSEWICLPKHDPFSELVPSSGDWPAQWDWRFYVLGGLDARTQPRLDKQISLTDLQGVLTKVAVSLPLSLVKESLHSHTFFLQEKTSIQNPVHLRQNPVLSHPDPRLLVSRTMRNKCLLCKPFSLWYSNIVTQID